MTESATGSFLYPPEQFESVQDYLEFFDSAAISDQVLSNATHAYRTWRQKSILAHIQAQHEAFVNTKDNVAYRMAKTHGREGLDLAIEAERPKWRAEAEGLYPVESLPRSQSRAVLRAHQMVFLRGMLPEQDEQAVLDHQIPHLGAPVRAEDLVDHYNTYEWAHEALTESDYAQADAMNRVASLLAAQQGITDYDDWH